MKITKKNGIIYGALGLLVLLAGIGIVKQSRNSNSISVTVAEAQKRTIRETVSASGKIYPVVEVKISSDVSGEIVDLYVKEGDSVVVGQILAKIDPDSYLSAVQRGEASLNASRAQLSISKSQIESSKAQKAQILAQLENARTIHKRNEQLKKDGVISQAEFDQSLSSVKQLEANLRAAEASIKSAQMNAEASEFSIKGAVASLNELKTSLDRTTIKAPTNGIISKLSVEKGERVVGTIQMAGTEMMRISNLNNMEVQVEVSENDILKVSVGDLVDIDVDAYIGKKFKGRVTEIANSASNIGTQSSSLLTNDQVTNFIVKVGIDEDSYKEMRTPTMKYPLRPGMSASVDIYTNEVQDVVAVPIQCVTIREKESNHAKKKHQDEEQEDIKLEELNEVAFVMEADTARQVVVTTGIQDDEFIEIKSGLKAGDQVISGPYNEVSKTLKGGDKVRKRIDKEDKD
ncbi:MAG: efflux RND transporter periplasmic adaptor subunit [Saprospiraceae bacterium]|nr:MAG: RND family efflux transporter MFP subunit [Bacteroidetes bacterium OLB9]MCO6464789.1 efflux RND transporter periplasmic adaptor subunit [Saprospiraceae bacterium]